MPKPKHRKKQAEKLAESGGKSQDGLESSGAAAAADDVKNKQEDQLMMAVERQQQEVDDDEEPPKPVSSDEESDGEEETSDNKVSQMALNSSSSSNQGSRFFSPYRTLGVISNGRPFHLIPHDHSGNAMVALPIGDRFQLMRTDHLRPVLVSQSVVVAAAAAAATAGGGRRKKASGGKQEISHVVTDATLSISVVAHGPQPTSSPNKETTTLSSCFYSKYVTIFQRTRPLAPARRIVPNHWCIQDLLHLGRIKVEMTGEKEGKLENAAVVAVVLRKLPEEDEDQSNGKPSGSVPVVGGGDDDSDRDEASSDDDDSDDGEEGEAISDGNCQCQIVVMIASRQSIRIHKRIHFDGAPTFSPLVATHPSTYLNKIVVGGFDSQTGKMAMALVNVRSGKIIHQFQCLTDRRSKITTLSQSPAVDTIAVGTSSGMVHLVNLKHDKKLFSLEHKSKKENKPVPITSVSFRTDSSALQYATAPMAVGRQDGTITIWDLTPPEDPRMGRTILCEIRHAHSPGGIAKLQFMPQEPLLLSIGTHSNSIVTHIFDNPDHSGRILRQRKGHTAPPRVVQYLHPGAGAGGGILANASDGTDAAACQILSSGGQDRTLRVFSTARTVKDKEFGQGRGLVKKAKRLGIEEGTTELLLPPVTALVTCEARSRDWGDLVTIHEDHAFAYVWSTRRGAQSGPVLRQDKWNVSAMKIPPPSHTNATSVVISTCGNFAMVGSRGGKIYKYNLESGIPRGTYPREDKDDKKKNKKFVPGDIVRAVKALEKTKKQSSRLANQDRMEIDAEQKSLQAQRLKDKLHEASHMGSAVTGMAVDSLNKTVISVGSDGKLILWNLSTHLPHKRSPYMLPAPATKMILVRDSGLAAIALNDYSVLIYDTSSLSVIRRFGTKSSLSVHQGPISDMAFSPDGRSLYTASWDSTLRVWDVPTDSCLDWLRFKSPPTSITVSPTGEFLATSHTGSVGLNVWSDRSFYETVYTDGEPPSTPWRMDEPTPLSETWEVVEANPATEKVVSKKPQQILEESEGPPVPKDKGLITLSGLPPSHWKNLFRLELVKERNKPMEAPKKPPSAPFFLQWRAGESMDGLEQKTKDNGPKEDEDEWAAAWSDDEEDEGRGQIGAEGVLVKPKRDLDDFDSNPTPKKRKIRHARSHLASLLHTCSSQEGSKNEGDARFRAVTEYIATLGPSGIDVAMSTLCAGLHDMEEGLPLLRITAQWLIEELRSNERYEVINAYLHRFLHIHGSVIAGIEEKGFALGDETDDKEAVASEREQLTRLLHELRGGQWNGSYALRTKMQQTTCLLRHFSRMV